MATKFLDAATSNGTGPELSLASFDPLISKRPTVYVFGVFDGADLNIEVSPDGVHWVLMTTFNDVGYILSSMSFSHIRATVVTAGPTTNLTAIIS